MRVFSVAVVLAFAGVAHICPAQFTVKQIRFPGNTVFSQQQLEAASGLKPGQKIGQAQMSAAAQQLMNTGAFDDIEVTLNGPATAIDMIFKVKPATLLPVTFENIVWLTPEERDTGLKQRVPLYIGQLPAAGTLQTQVQTALQQMLEAKGVHATVEGFQKPSTSTRATTAVAFRVTQPSITLSNVKLAGVTTELAPAERSAIQGVVGSVYNEGIDSHLEDSLLAAYRNAGYLDATLQNFTRTPGVEAAGSVPVTISAQVDAGQPYRVSAVQWDGSEMMSADAFAKENTLHTGDVASAMALKKSEEALLDAYRKQGYVDVVIDPQPVKDAAAHTVAYHLSVTPGAVYHVSSVNEHGLSAQAQKEFDSAWKLKPGAVYDAVYATHFLQLNTALRSLQPYTGKVDTVAHPETHTVDVNITFFANNRG